ncbi:MAG: type II toxin-antitoxin system YafQ family toxin [Tannerella sp.]|nr:type II toxin-antitoxin system YafQ family toxin [Tannerella sp.]
MKKSQVSTFLHPDFNKEGNRIKYKYTLQVTNRFKKDVQRCRKAGYDLELLRDIVIQLTTDGKLPQEYLPHPLVGEYKECMECHIKADWLIVWKQEDNKMIIVAIATGTHNYLFE